jgi:hypothetical protein
VRLLAAIACVPVLLAAQDAREIVRRSVELDRTNDQIAREYTYLQRQDTRTLDSSGAVKNRSVVTYDVTMLEGSPYRRLVARDDHPLPLEEEKKEQEKVLRSIEERSKETAEQRKRRLDEAEERRNRTREELREIPDAFDFILSGEVQFDGNEVWIIDATPRPGYKAKAQMARFVGKAKGRFWIAKQDYHWVKAEIETLDTVSVGGIFLRMAKGSRVELEQTRVNGDVWLPKSIVVRASARVLLVKSLRLDLDYSYSNYKKFQVDSRVVSPVQ